MIKIYKFNEYNLNEELVGSYMITDYINKGDTITSDKFELYRNPQTVAKVGNFVRGILFKNSKNLYVTDSKHLLHYDILKCLVKNNIENLNYEDILNPKKYHNYIENSTDEFILIINLTRFNWVVSDMSYDNFDEIRKNLEEYKEAIKNSNPSYTLNMP
jgi:hypothetical protein